MGASLDNDPVPTDALPALESVALTPVTRRFAGYRMTVTLLFWWPLALLVAVAPVGPELPWLARGALGLMVAALGGGLAALAGAEARRRAYGLRRQDLIYASGLLVQRTTVLPVCRIQHVETISGPLERLFGLVRVTCYTAGGASADLVLAGLPRETAERIRQYLLERIRAGDTGAGEAGDGPP